MAILGGPPVRSEPFPPHPIIGEAEKSAVMEVLESGRLSTFLATPGEYFLGGEKIREFEAAFADYHEVDHAVAFNSGTAALHAAVVAVGVQPGDEVIVPPTTFTSTATAALMHNAIPVFADVDGEGYGLDPKAVAQAVTPLTRALIVVHLFGNPADMDGLGALARDRELPLIEDCAQAPGAEFQNRKVGTMGDCGVFSLTESKNITTGEGGMLITNNPNLAEVAGMVRNHGEVILEGQTLRTYVSTMLGWNYRMTEMEAALGIVQLGRMDELNRKRIELADRLSSGLQGVEGLRVPVVRPGDRHVYYVYPLKYDEARVGIPRDLFVRAVNAEGIPCSGGYVRPLYFSPLYHAKKAFPFTWYKGKAKYDPGICPTAERLYERELVLTPVVRPPATLEDMDQIVAAVGKVLDQREELLRNVDA